MRVAVYGDAPQLDAWHTKKLADGHEVIVCNDVATFQQTVADVCFQFGGNALLVQPTNHVTVFMNSVITTTTSFPAGVTRFNGWPGFFEKEIIEIAAAQDDIQTATVILNQLGIRHTVAPDEPGFIAARIIAMIINEAYFALADEVSEKEEINTAMKLGTNYPHGPFEWAAIIGLDNVIQLLEMLALADDRYTPCQAMINEMKTI